MAFMSAVVELLLSEVKHNFQKASCSTVLHMSSGITRRCHSPCLCVCALHISIFASVLQERVDLSSVSSPPLACTLPRRSLTCDPGIRDSVHKQKSHWIRPDLEMLE